ncbi:MAG: hypothetical protein M1819_001511, partial [Sarea resinae]
MLSASTCQRCLAFVRSSTKPSAKSIRPLKQQVGRRYLSVNASSSSSSSPSSTRHRLSTNSSFTRNFRNASSLSGQKGEVPVSEPVEVPTPGGLADMPPPETVGRPLLQPNNLFHPFSESPSPEIRQRAAFIKQHASCPHPAHHQTRVPASPTDPEARKSTSTETLPPAHVSFECPDCGIPVYCTEDHWADDYESHLEICDTLREINEDDHDLRSGRFFPEFEYPGEQLDEAMINMTNWDTFLYSREFRAINDERSLRQATRLLTYPVTIGSILHELSPYHIRRGGRLTPEGLKSFS